MSVANKPLSRNQLIGIATVEVILSISIFNYLLNHQVQWFKNWLYAYEIFFLIALALRTIQLVLNNQNHLVHSITHFVLFPWLYIGAVSKTKKIASFTMPVVLLVIIVPISTFLSGIIDFLLTGANCNKNTTPYLNLTVILISFAYFQKFFYRYFVSISPNSFNHIHIIQSVQALSDYPFVKLIAFWLLAVLSVINTIEKLSGKNLYLFNLPQTNVIIEALVTLVVIDRALSISNNKINEHE